MRSDWNFKALETRVVYAPVSTFADWLATAPEYGAEPWLYEPVEDCRLPE